MSSSSSKDFKETELGVFLINAAVYILGAIFALIVWAIYLTHKFVHYTKMRVKGVVERTKSVSTWFKTHCGF
jgi:hypothetical protein